MSDTSAYLIRALQTREASKAHGFILAHGEWSIDMSLQSYYHNAATIFVAVDQQGEWVGIIVSYLSPASRGKAAIEGVTVHEGFRRKGIASLLLAYTFDYWKNQCVFHISYIPGTLNPLYLAFLDKLGFQSADKDDLMIFVKKLLPEKICVHNRLMRPSMNTINGDVGEDTLFEYFQKGDDVWGTYSGGNVVRGVLLGKMAPDGDINFRYQQLCTNGEIYTGTSKSSTEFLNDGRIVLYEDWEWTGNRSGGGRSVIEEIKE